MRNLTSTTANALAAVIIMAITMIAVGCASTSDTDSSAESDVAVSSDGNTVTTDEAIGEVKRLRR